MLKEVLAAVLESGFLLDDPIHQIGGAEARGWNKWKSVSSSLHFKFLKSKEKNQMFQEAENRGLEGSEVLYAILWRGIHVAMYLF